MVDEITPTYYASGRWNPEFELRGQNFDLIPDDAMGIISNDNDDPLKLVGEGTRRTQLTIVERGEGYLKLQSNTAHSYDGDFYLGVLMKRSTLEYFWINDTKPLP